jgi:hypothetical protein
MVVENAIGYDAPGNATSFNVDVPVDTPPNENAANPELTTAVDVPDKSSWADVADADMTGELDTAHKIKNSQH